MRWLFNTQIQKQLKSGALSCRLMHSCSAMDRHMQHAMFHTIAFFAFSCLAISTLASWCRKFMSRIFHPCNMVPHFHVPQFHVSHFQRPHSFCVETSRHFTWVGGNGWRHGGYGLARQRCLGMGMGYFVHFATGIRVKNDFSNVMRLSVSA